MCWSILKTKSVAQSFLFTSWKSALVKVISGAIYILEQIVGFCDFYLYECTLAILFFSFPLFCSSFSFSRFHMSLFFCRIYLVLFMGSFLRVLGLREKKDTLLSPSLLKSTWCWRHILTCLPDILFFSPTSGFPHFSPLPFPCLGLTLLSSSSTFFELVSFLELSFVPQIQGPARCCHFSFQSLKSGS